jgi:hypothetical protein
MNKLLLIAAILATATTAIHTFIGGKEIAGPLLASSLAEVPRLTLYAVWHMATAALALSSVALFVGAVPRFAASWRPMVLFVSALWLAFGTVFVIVAISQSGAGLYLKLPQWALLLPVGVLGMLGANKSFKGTPNGAP